MAHLTAGSGDVDFNISKGLFIVVFQVAIFALQALDLLFEKKFRLDSGARDAAITGPVGLMVQFIARGAATVRLI